MSLPIVTSKLYIPRSAALIARPRLAERLTKGWNRKLTLVAAPTGSGKTSLVSAWLREIDQPAAWLSLDAADSEPARFINYLVAACQQLEPAIGQSVLDLLQTPQPPLERMMTRLINDFADTNTGRQYLLVLDDYHLIEEISVHEAPIGVLTVIGVVEIADTIYLLRKPLVVTISDETPVTGSAAMPVTKPA